MLGSKETSIPVGFTELVERVALFRTNNDGKCVLYLAIEGGHKEFVMNALEKLRSQHPALDELIQNRQELVEIISQDIEPPPLPQEEEDEEDEGTDDEEMVDDEEWMISQGRREMPFPIVGMPPTADMKMEIEKPVPISQHGLKARKQQESIRKSPLSMAIIKKDTDILRMILLATREWIHLKDDEGKIPIHYAASIGYVDGVEVLLKKCISCITVKDKDGLSPLHLACAGGHTKVVEKLLEHEHCPNPREILDNYGRNMVHIAAVMGKFDVIKYILQDDGLVDMINDQENEGNTPLHLATMICHPKVVHALTWNERVDLTSVNKKNETALDISLKYKSNNPSLRQRLVWTALKSACVVQHAEKGSHSIEVPLPECGNYYPRWKNENMDLYKDRINTLILVSTIITTVAFAAGITLPGGTNSSDPGHGMALMLKHAWFKLFIFCITVSMYGSISTIIILLWAQLGDITLAFYSLKVAMPVLGVTLTSLSVAFMAAIHLVISDLSWLATTIMILCVIFIFMLLFLYVILCWFPSESRNPIIRRISSYPFRFEAWLDKQDD